MSDTHNSSAGGQVPDPSDVERVFRHHQNHFSDTSGEIAYQQLQDEESIRRQYSGRVLFELLQNALDRAESTVHVQVQETDLSDSGHALVVANDGIPLRVDPDYDYDTPPEVRKGRRSDFHALCSLHTSNKSPDKSVGNKGIGFRSVFWLGDYVRVWSRFKETPGWWGMEMHSPIDRNTWEERLETRDIKRGHEAILQTQETQLDDTENRPSFHFPLPLRSESSSALQSVDDATTAVVVPIHPERKEKLLESVEEIHDSHLRFVGLFEDRRDLTVHVETPVHSFQRMTWPDSDDDDGGGNWSMVRWRSPDLSELAERAEHGVSVPGAAVGWPGLHEGFTKREEGGATTARIYGYLPTLVNSPFGIDIQADFQLRTDRTGLRLNDDLTGPYNKKLLKAATELHLLEIFRRVGIPEDTVDWPIIDPGEVEQSLTTDDGPPRRDLWCLLDPQYGDSDAADVVVEHIQSLLFADGGKQDAERYEIWARLAEKYFSQRSAWSVATYRSFWTASEKWVDRFCPHSNGTKTWRRMATALCDALRERQASVAPITATERLGTKTEAAAVPLPERGDAVGVGGGSSRQSKALFLRTADDSLELPDALRAANRAVTAFNFPSGFDDEPPQPLGARRFNRWEVLGELRQIPNSLENWSYQPLHEDPERACELQRGLIRFAGELFVLDSRGYGVAPVKSNGYRTGWRVLDGDPYTDNARRAGRSLATLYLPTTDSEWEPARQLTRDRVAEDDLGTLPDDVDVDAFLAFLGVAPAPPEDGPPLAFVEGGPDGVVESRDVPPALTAPGQGRWKDPSLGRLPNSIGEMKGGETRSEFSPSAWRASVRAAWDEWLAELLHAERAARVDEDQVARTDLVGPLGTRSWYPLDGDADTAISPAVVHDAGTRIAPRDLTLLSSQQTQFPTILWSLNRGSPDRELLEILGAVEGVDAETLGRDGANPAFRLLDQLRGLDLDRIERNPRARQALVRLFGRLVDAIVREDEDERGTGEFPLLTFSAERESRALAERQLQWCSQDEDAWIAANNADRESMRRLFSETRLVAATIGPEVLASYSPLADRGISIEPRVRPERQGEEAAELVTEFEEMVSPIVPQLLALAESAHQVDVDPVQAADRWRQRTFRYVEDAWIEFRATLGNTETLSEERFKENYDDALFLTDDPPTIIFDTPPDTERLPPLAEFGEPLAELLLGDGTRGAGSLFARALGAYEADGRERLQRLLEKKDAAPLVEAYERHFQQLDEGEKNELLKKIRRTLSELDVELYSTPESFSTLSHLGPDDVEASDASAELRGSEIDDALRSLNLTEAQESFQPRFSCRDHHLSVWRSWFEDWNDRLVPYLLDLLRSNGVPDMDEDELTDRLRSFVNERECPRVAFTPQAAVIRWLTRERDLTDEAPDPTNLEEHVREFSPLYNDVTTIRASKESSWNRPSVGAPDPVEKERGTVDPSDVAETMRARGAVGLEAERAARKYVASTTAECLEEAQNRGEIEQAWSRLTSSVPSGGTTEDNLRHARTRWEQEEHLEDLAKGLHVASVWDGAGYDVLGLERDEEAALQPVRYEIKGLPADSDTVKVYLTSNEISVYREVCLKNSPGEPRYNGDWRLVGIKPDGSAIDLSPELGALRDPLASLRAEGYNHDGLVLYVEESV